MDIAVIGTGYVGLVAGTGFAEFGNNVTCVDVNRNRIDQLNAGQIPIYEPGLTELVLRNSSVGRLHFTTNVAEAVPNAKVVFIAVGTPQSNDGSADLQYVLSAARELAKHLSDGAVVVNKSTVPVGTAALVREAIEKETNVSFSVASNPEFLKEGDAVNDFMKPNRIVIGVDTEEAEKTLLALYEPFFRKRNRVLVMDPVSAELTKYAANAMLATRISFMNELSQVAEAVGADIDNVRRGIGSDERIGPSFLFSGPGFGGACFPKDTRALIQIADAVGQKVEVVDATVRANERQKKILGKRVLDYFGNELAGKRIGVWGLTFKAKTDDIRESPALILINQLLDAGAEVIAYDPEGMENTKVALGDVIFYGTNPYQTVEGVDALCVVTEWKEFRAPSFEKLAQLMKGKALFDGRNLWNAEEANKAGFDYYAIGKGFSKA